MQWAAGAGGKGVLEQSRCSHHPQSHTQMVVTSSHTDGGNLLLPPPAKGIPLGQGREDYLSYISGTVCTAWAIFAWKLAQNKV